MFRFGFIGDILRWILDNVYHVIPNYGWAVIVFTLIMRLILMPLDIKSKQSMKRMNDVKPQLDAINKKYAKDKEKLNQKTQELYKKEKINPLAGCLPMLIQLPFMFAMYAIMREVAGEQLVKLVLDIKTALDSGVANYQPAFQSFFWIKNVFQPDSFMATVVPAFKDPLGAIGATALLSSDQLNAAKAFLATDQYANWAAAFGNAPWYTSTPIILFGSITIPWKINGLFILPLVAAVSQYFSTQLMTAGTPQQPAADGKPNTNQFMKYFFPLFSIWICATSNAGFALYWVSLNLIQLAQQFFINRWFKYKDAQNKLSKGELT